MTANWLSGDYNRINITQSWLGCLFNKHYFDHYEWPVLFVSINYVNTDFLHCFPFHLIFIWFFFFTEYGRSESGSSLGHFNHPDLTQVITSRPGYSADFNVRQVRSEKKVRLLARGRQREAQFLMKGSYSPPGICPAVSLEVCENSDSLRGKK